MPIVVGKNGEEIIVDDIDYEKAMLHKWYAEYSKRGFTRILTRINGKRVSFTSIVFGTSRTKKLLHKNGNPFDFSRENILICNNSEFMHIIMKQSGITSKYYGVYYDNTFSRWITKIKKGDKKISGGGYLLEEEAAIVADYLTLTNYGEIGKRNFPEMDRTQIEDCYKGLQNKYGYSSIEKNAKSNQGRKPTYKKSSSRFVGVTWDKHREKWVSQTMFKKKHIYIGRFENEETAARAYDAKALALFGKYAKLNFPND